MTVTRTRNHQVNQTEADLRGLMAMHHQLDDASILSGMAAT